LKTNKLFITRPSFEKDTQKGFTLIELLVVVGLIGILAAIIIPNVLPFIGRGDEESKNTEYKHVQTAVTAMLAQAKLDNVATELDADYVEIDTLAEVQGVKATDLYTLDTFLIGGDYPFKQSYDISKIGVATVHE
jgi:prepilin-type N-terminal cleavage/methylation domain-containing protein